MAGPPLRGLCYVRPYNGPACASTRPGGRSSWARSSSPCWSRWPRIPRGRCPSWSSPASSSSFSATRSARPKAAVADVVSPADGRVGLAGDPEPGAAPPGQWKQVSIFLSPMDVHVNRVPVSGRVLRVDYKPGKFLPAYKREAAIDNERNEFWIDHAGQTIVCRQVVGILARRIVCRVPVGADVRTGERFGVMKFGSRIDLFLPPTATVKIAGRRSGRLRSHRGRNARRERAASGGVAPGAPADPLRRQSDARAARLHDPQPVHAGEPVLRLRVRHLLDARGIRDRRPVHRDCRHPRHARRAHRTDDWHRERVRAAVRFAGRHRVVRDGARRSCRSRGGCPRSGASAGRPRSCS